MSVLRKYRPLCAIYWILKEFNSMVRVIIFSLIILFYSCVTSRSIKHFASKKKLTIKEAQNINFFNGKIEIENGTDREIKGLVYLLYENDSLHFISNTKSVTNNEYVYKISIRTKFDIILTRATMFPRYYTVDTLLFNADFAIEKSCLYDRNQIVQTYFKVYGFSNDTLSISSYQFDRDVLPILLYHSDLHAIRKKIGEAYQVRLFPNQEKRTFFKRFM